MNELPDDVVKLLCEAYREMNIIRARDGVPHDSNGRKSDVSQDYWDDIMARLDNWVWKSTGAGAWHNPILFKK